MNYDSVIEEIRAMREDLRRHVRSALWVFAGSVVLVCAVFGLERKELLHLAPYALIGGMLLGVIYIAGLIFQSVFRALARKRHERESFAILSGRSRVSRRQ